MTTSTSQPLPAAPAERDRTSPSGAFRVFAWVALFYTFAVILFGAVVRITGSGAGCGQHWPTCHGEVAHLPQSTETLIELTHRVTSGLCLPLVIVMAIWAYRRFPRGHGVRRVALLSVVFMVVEALVGASLVLLELVGANASASRAVFMSLHLVSTCSLTAVMAATAWGSREGRSLLWRVGHSSVARRIVGALVALVVVSMTGAITALGDTLYPVAAGTDLSQRVLPDGHFLEQLRIVHPVIAVLTSGWLLHVASHAEVHAGSTQVEAWGRWIKLLVVLQVFAGAVNIGLGAPGWMQVIHLALATGLWVVTVLLYLAAQDELCVKAPSPASY